MNRFSKYIFIVNIFLLMSSCTHKVPITKMYSGPDLPKEHVAILMRGGSDIKILKLDGKGEGFKDKFCNVGRRCRLAQIHLLPGGHEVIVRFEYEYYVGRTTGGSFIKHFSEPLLIRFNVLPGHTYWMCSGTGAYGPGIVPRRWKPSIHDISSRVTDITLFSYKDSRWGDFTEEFWEALNGVCPE